MACTHSWNLSPSEAVSLQQTLRERVILQPLPSQIQVLGAADVGYVPSMKKMVAAMVTFQWPDLTPLEAAQSTFHMDFPYIPGLLSFREVPPLLEAFESLGRKPDVILCDGQGIAHPRKLGLASHLGICLDLPTVGCAKKKLCGNHETLPLIRGQCQPLMFQGERVGYVLCSRTGVKPIYISPGHKADGESSLQLVRRCLGTYRIPQPLRHAHHLATRLRNQLAAQG